MPLKLQKTVEATNPPVTDTEQKLHAKIDLDDDDLLITSLNETATDFISDTLERAFTTETWELSLDEFPLSGCPIELFRAPVLAITSIQYIDTDGVTQTLATTEFTLDDKAEPASIFEAFQKTWPSTRDVINAVTVTFTVGYGTLATTVPEKFKTLIKHYFTHLYEHREPVKDKTWVRLPDHLDALINKYKLNRFG